MRKIQVFAIISLALLLLGMLPVCAGTDLYPSYLVTVHDVDDLLTEEQEYTVNAALSKALDQAGIPVCAYVFYSQRGEQYWGDDFLAEFGLSEKSPMILLVVSVTSSEVFYDIYTYGDAYSKISQKEIDYILDDTDVYNNLKRGRIEQGLCAYAELSAQAYSGRLGVSWRPILLVGLIIGAVVATISVKSISACYKRKNPSQSYPLDRFATLDLRRSHDRVVGKFVTHTVISTSGGRGGRGGGSPMGGGGGHRGGR